MCSIANRKLDVAQLLLDYGATVNGPSFLNGGRYIFDFGTPLLKAVQNNFIEGVVFLLDHRADPNFLENNWFQTPPHFFEHLRIETYILLNCYWITAAMLTKFIV